MNPNGQAPLDYLNQIAPQAPKKPLFQLTIGRVVAIGAILIVVAILLSIVASALGGNGKAQWQQLSARIAATSTIADSATANIKTSQLRSLNSELKLTLTNTTRDLNEILANKSIDVKKIPVSITTKESAEAIATELEDGRLNNKYDSTYAREMSYQLARLLTLINQMITTSSGTSKEFLETTKQNLTPIYEGIENFGSTSE